MSAYMGLYTHTSNNRGSGRDTTTEGMAGERWSVTISVAALKTTTK